MSKQLTLADTQQPPARPTPQQSEMFAQNGKLWQKIVSQLSTTRKNLEGLGELLGDAVSRKIWLGFIHPKTGKLCNFAYTNSDGEVDDSLSFKMWLSTAPERGGLGIDDLSIVESSIRHDPALKAQIIPMIVDGHNIALANRIRKENGEPPLLALNSSKAATIRKLTNAPEIFSKFYESRKIQRDFLLHSLNHYNNLPDEQQATALETLETIFERCTDDDDPTATALTISRLLGSNYFKSVTLYSDPAKSAQNIAKFFNDDPEQLKKLSQELLALC